MKSQSNENLNSTKNRKPNIFAIIILIIAIAYVVTEIFLPMKSIAPTISDVKPQELALSPVAWPTYGESAIGAANYGVLSSNGEQNGRPIASIAKATLALAVLKEKPLKIGEQGPTYKITDQDIELYKSNLAQNGSVAPVALGEELTEYQLLQALLVPSGDNIADTLAIWAFGSVKNYLDYINKMVGDMGLEQTHLADASGLSPQSVSSASDLVALGEKVMGEPVLKEIVGQSQITLPVLGTAKNYNTLLGTDGIIGIKTGNTDEAGGCLLFAYTKNINGKDTTMIGAILGASSRAKVLNDTKNFVEANESAFGYSQVISKNAVVGKYVTPWGKNINILAKDDLSILTAKNNPISISVSAVDVSKPLNAGEKVGEITVKSGSKSFTVPAIIAENITKPPLLWKLIHPFK